MIKYILSGTIRYIEFIFSHLHLPRWKQSTILLMCVLDC